jgi:exodeoxyribonuclease VII small subunit
MSEVSFEKAVEELESIVKKLEEGNLSLEDALYAFERGVHLRKICEGKLDSAQLKIETLLKQH